MEEDRSQKNPPPARARSISRVLTVVLVLTVMFTSAVVVTPMYYNASQRAKARLEEKAKEYSDSLDHILELPMWNFDKETLRKIGAAYAQNELIEKLTITDDTGRPYFDFTRQSSAPLIKRRLEIVHDGHVIGAVEVSLTSKYYREANRQLLWSAIGTLCVAILALAVATGFLLRLLLNKPLKRVGEVVNSYASGRYDNVKTDMPFLEFQPLLAVLGEMGSTITSQMTELQNAEKKYRSIFENALEGIFQATPDGRFLSVNPAMARMLGYDSPEDLIGQINDIGRQLYVDPGRREELLQLMREGRTVTGFEIQLHRKDGSVVWTRAHARPILNETGKLGLLEGILTDITERKKAEAERQRLEEQLRQSQKMEAIGTLTGGIAHDFNNILGIIIGNTELAMDDVPKENPANFNLEEIHKASLRARDVIKQLLSFSRQTDQERKPVKLVPIVNETIELLRVSIPKNVDIIHNIDAGSDTIFADPTQIHQLILNLCTNAAHAMEDTGGALEVGIKNVVFDEASDAPNPDLTAGEYVKLTISDTGPGISPKIKDRIFDPYFTTKDVGKGTGMGLSVVHGIVKSHGGAIIIDSELKKGTTFSIFFKAIEKEPDEEIETEEMLPVGNERILFVDDEASMVYVGQYRLERLGYKIEARTNPVEALEEFHAHPDLFDLVITDMSMPQMTGDRLVKEILKTRPDMPVILCTGFSEKIDENKAKEIGIRQYLEKPINRRDLAFMVRRVLDEK